jgi:hypothetical protein
MDELETKVWKIEKPEDQLAVTSGAELLQRLKASGTGEDKILFGLSFFDPPDEDTGEVPDVPAVKLAKKFFAVKEHELTDNGAIIGEITKQKVKDIVELGEWKERPAPKADPTSLLSRVKKLTPPKKADAKVEGKKDGK